MEILEIAVVGIGLKFLIDLIKTYFGTEGIQTKILTGLLAVILGAAIYFLSGTPLWVSITGVLGATSTVYAFMRK